MDWCSVLSILAGITIGIYVSKKRSDEYKRKCNEINNRKL